MSGTGETIGGAPQYTFSVLIGRVSTEDGDRILQTLKSLDNQQGSHRCEVIVADRLNDAISEKIRSDFPETKMLPMAPDCSLPQLRASALAQAQGEFVIVTEDHCVPPDDWIDSIARCFAEAPDETVAVGGCVENGVDDTGLDWATFLCEYSYFLSPVAEGAGGVLPGMNVAYRKSALEALDSELLTSGFWETTVHPVLQRAGLPFYSSNRIRIFHSKKFSLGLFARQRFIYSRYYAGLRFQPRQLPLRLVAFCASVVLPPLLLFRIVKQVRAKQRLRLELRSALPYLAVFVVIWAAGEMAGYLFGPGDALARIE